MKKINPPCSWLTISLWGICFFSIFSSSGQIYVGLTPKERLVLFFKWYDKTDKIPTETDCLEVDGLDITSMNTNCIENYIKAIKKTGHFSNTYLNNLREEFVNKKKDIQKNTYASLSNFDRYTLSQDPPTGKELILALKSNSSTLSINNKTSIVTLNLKKPYVSTLKYTFELENNVWKLSKIESK